MSRPDTGLDGFLASWSPSVQAQVAERLSKPDLGRWLAQVQQVGRCAHPVRLAGSTDTIDTATGEVLPSYDTAAEPDGVAYLRCGNRRASVCPSCSHEYQGDVWHVLMAGAAGRHERRPRRRSRRIRSCSPPSPHPRSGRCMRRRSPASAVPGAASPQRRPAPALPARPAAVVHGRP